MKIREFVEEWLDDDGLSTEDFITGLEMIFKGQMTGPNEIRDKDFWERAFLASLSSCNVHDALDRADVALVIYRERRNA